MVFFFLSLSLSRDEPSNNLILTLIERYLMHIVAVVGVVELFGVLSDSPDAACFARSGPCI